MVQAGTPWLFGIKAGVAAEETIIISSTLVPFKQLSSKQFIQDEGYGNTKSRLFYSVRINIVFDIKVSPF